MKITIFDTETTGIFPKGDFNDINLCPYMLQLGSITYDTNTNCIVDKINSIIKIPDNIEIPETATEVNNINKERTVKEGVEIGYILDTFNKQLKATDLLVAHNLEFDINIVNYECIRNNIDFEYKNMKKEQLYCTMSHGTQLCKIKKENTKGKYYKWPKLEELHYHLFGQKLTNLHDAYNDLIICLRCYMFMNFKIDVCDKNNDLKQQIENLIDKSNDNELPST